MVRLLDRGFHGRGRDHMLWYSLAIGNRKWDFDQFVFSKKNNFGSFQLKRGTKKASGHPEA